MGDRLVKWVGKETRQNDTKLTLQKGKIRDVVNRWYAIVETCYMSRKSIEVKESPYYISKLVDALWLVNLAGRTLTDR